jgi:UDP-N-acetylglucosamine/UDP-N-acetylgalactosamine diphosphorylase
MTLDYERAAARLARHGQGHLLRWYDELSASARARLLAQIEALDLDWLERMLATPAERSPRQIAPYTGVVRIGDARDGEALEAGRAALREGRVGVLLVAGGQGTRLGFDGPKGSYPIGPVTGNTLFQIHAERVLAAGRRHGAMPVLYLMTSPDNHQATLETFAANGNFGLPEDALLVFQQGLAPAVDHDGKLLLAGRDRLVLTPNGNGGAFAALRDSGAFDHMRQRGIDTLAYLHVDNPLGSGCDPRFVGHHLLAGSAFSCKAIPKLGPEERVGCFALVGGRLGIVEYTEIPAELAHATGDDGRLLLGLANPGLFIWSRPFAEAQAARRDLPYHRAHKKIPHLNREGNLVRPGEPCGYKFESFAMDTLADAGQTLLLECRREEEFAPVKNAEGADSPQTARTLMSALYAGWLKQAGCRVPDDAGWLEISPLYAQDAEELAQRLSPGLEVTGDLYLGDPEARV